MKEPFAEQMTLRPVRNDDIPAMTAHRLAYLQELQGEREPDYMQKLEKELSGYFSEGIRSGYYYAVVAESGGRILGYGAMVIRRIPGDMDMPTRLEADILNMYTLPSARRQGVGSRILEHLLLKARELGLVKLALHTSKDGEQLYRSFGFSEPEYPYLELEL